MSSDDRIYACVDCGKLRTKAEGGTVFSVCDLCWNKKHPPKSDEVEKLAKDWLETWLAADPRDFYSYGRNAFIAGFKRGKESSEAYIDPNCTWACMCGKRSKNHENALDEVLKAAEQHLKDIGEPSPYAPVFDLEKIKEIITTLRKDRK